MRKLVIGIIIGAALTFSGQALAETISNVGKKIQNEYTVVVDGVTLEKKAIAIDGSSYTPNRVLAEALGLDIDFKNNTVYFSGKEEVPIEDVTVISEMTDTLDTPVATEEKVLSLEEINEKIKSVMGYIKAYEALLATNPPEEKVAIINQKIAEEQAKLADLEAKKSVLESQ